MNRKTAGALLMALGVLLVVLAGVLVLTNGEEEPTAMSTSTTTTEVTSTTTTTALVAPTSTVPTTTTTTLAPPTTMLSERALVGGFVTQFGLAIENGDAEFVQSHLHPKIVEGFGEEVCQNWVNTQIMALENYIATGAPQGPSNGSLSTPGGTVEFENRYSVDVTFTFGAEEFETTADFIVEGETVYFTGSCES